MCDLYFFLPDVIVSSGGFTFLSASPLSCSNRGGEWHESRMLSGTLIQNKALKQDTSTAPFSLTNRERITLFEYNFLINQCTKWTCLTGMSVRNTQPKDLILLRNPALEKRFHWQWGQLQKDSILQMLQTAANLQPSFVHSIIMQFTW